MFLNTTPCSVFWFVGRVGQDMCPRMAGALTSVCRTGAPPHGGLKLLSSMCALCPMCFCRSRGPPLTLQEERLTKEPVTRPPPDQIEALLLPFDLYYVALSAPSYGHRTGAVKWRVLEHAVSARRVFQPSWVSPQVVLCGAPDIPCAKPF